MLELSEGVRDRSVIARKEGLSINLVFVGAEFVGSKSKVFTPSLKKKKAQERLHQKNSDFLNKEKLQSVKVHWRNAL